MQRIALDTRLITHTGVGTYVRTVFASLPEASGDFQYLAITNPGLPTLPSIPTVSVRSNPLGIGAQLLPWELRHVRASLLHVPYFTAPLAWTGRLVLTIHDLIPLAIPDTVESPLRRAGTVFWTRLAARRADMIVTDSEFSRQDIERRLGIPTGRIAVVPAAVAPEFRPGVDSRAVDAFRGTLGTDRYVLCMGRDKPHKNLRRLVQAFGRVRKLSDVQLVIVGLTGPSPDLAREIAAAGVRDAVRFVGHVPAEVLPSYYQAAVAVVLPSLYEGFGLPALEAMACGTPVVAANRTAIPEVVGDAALLVDPEDTLALADAMIRVTQYEDLRQRLRARGLARARIFTPQAAASLLVGVYHQVLDGPTHAGLDRLAAGHNSGEEVM
jgi:alpha-1,3-rhamnosyl/mannosyltransferase